MQTLPWETKKPVMGSWNARFDFGKIIRGIASCLKPRTHSHSPTSVGPLAHAVHGLLGVAKRAFIHCRSASLPLLAAPCGPSPPESLLEFCTAQCAVYISAQIDQPLIAVFRIHHPTKGQLPFIAHARGLRRPLFCLSQSRQQHGGKNFDNRNHDEQFNLGKSSEGLLWRKLLDWETGGLHGLCWIYKIVRGARLL